MSPSILQFSWTDPNTSASSTSLAFPSNLTAGSTILALTVLNFTSLAATPFSDTLTSTYSQINKAQSNAGPGNQTFYLYGSYNSAGGANTVQLNLGSASGVRGLLLLEVGGVATSPLDGSAHSDQTSPGTGPGAVVSGTATSSNPSAIAIAFSMPIFSNSTPSAVSPYTSAGSFFSSSTTGRCESQVLSSSGSQQATFTATTGTIEHLSLIVVLDALPIPPPGMQML